MHVIIIIYLFLIIYVCIDEYLFRDGTFGGLEAFGMLTATVVSFSER